MELVTQLTSDTGINVFSEDYAITAGNPPPASWRSPAP
jgi:hypothetical protein